MSHEKDYAPMMVLADTLLTEASKATIVECARLLALNLAHYQLRFGTLPLEATIATLNADELNDEQRRLVAEGMETLIGMLLIAREATEIAQPSTLN